MVCQVTALSNRLPGVCGNGAAGGRKCTMEAKHLGPEHRPHAGPASAPRDSPRQVLLVTGYLWGGGAEWHLLNLAWNLRKIGVQVDVAYVLAGAAGAETSWRKYGFEPVRLRGPGTLWRLRARGYDLVHAHLFKGEMAGTVLSRVLAVPLVLTRHSLDWANLPAWQRKTLQAVVQRRAGGIIAISDAVAEVTRTALAGRPVPVRVIRHGVDPELLKDKMRGTDLRAELGLQGRKLLGTVARLSPDKGLTYLLQAYHQAQPALADWHIVIAGDGPQRATLAEHAAQLGIADRLHLLGWRDDAMDVVKALDVFALPSIREGFGLALLEAMTAGTAAVASDLPSIRETAGDAVLYVPPADKVKLAQALRQLADQPQLREDLAARSRRQAQRFSAEQMARQTVDFYATTLRGGAGVHPPRRQDSSVPAGLERRAEDRY